MKWKWVQSEWGAAVVAAVLGLLAYAVNLGGTYIYDDVYIVQEDARLKSVAGWGEIFTKDYNNGGVDNLYRPLITLSYAVEHQLHGAKEGWGAWAFHFVNWVLYGGCCALCAVFVTRLGGGRAGWIAGVLFAVHPVHVESVSGIVGRAEVVCLMGLVGGMILFLKRPLTGRRVAGIVACFVVAVGAKEQGMLLPLLLLLLDKLRDYREAGAVDTGGVAAGAGRGPTLEYAGGGVIDPVSAEKRMRQYLTLALCFLLAGYIVLREQVLKLHFYYDRSFLDWSMQPLVRSAGAERWGMPVVLLGRYAWLLVWPARLSPDYGGSVIGWSVRWGEPWVYVGVGAVVGWVVLAAWAAWRRRGVMLFALLALAVTYGLVGNVVGMIGVNFAERLMFTPSLFFVMAVALLLGRVPRAGWVNGAVIVLAALGLGRTVTYAWEWNDRMRFYSYCAAHQPGSARVWMMLASEQMARGDLAGARVSTGRAIEVEPEYTGGYRMGAEVAERMGDYERADALLLTARDLPLAPVASIILRRARLRGDHAGYFNGAAKTTGPATTREGTMR